MDWDPLLLSDERNYEDDEKGAVEDESNYVYEKRDAAEDAKAIPAMDDSVVAAPATNNSIEDEELPSDDGGDSTMINRGNSLLPLVAKVVSPDCSPLDVLRFWWMKILFVTLLQKQIGMLHKCLQTGLFPNLPG